MIRKFIKKVIAKVTKPSASTPAVLPAARYGITPEHISPGARLVCETLQRHGHQAYVVGGAVRDLLLSRTPKDFDVATDAHPEQVRALFRRAHIIGRRFKIVHVYHGRETVEVTTFRGLVDPDRAPVDAHGRLLDDNVFGTHAEDAQRRDFTINALYYDPVAGVLHDFHHGVGDIEARTLRVIGDPEQRYREDPVRMLRAVRLAAKLDLLIDPAARAPIRRLAPLLENVPPARLFDEVVKILTSGHALACLERLREEGLHGGLLPVLDLVFDHPSGERFVRLALEDSDRRIREGKSASPAFSFAALLWPRVLEEWRRRQAQGEPVFPAMEAAMDTVLETQAESLAITRKLAGDIRELWMMQPRFERRAGKAPYRLIEQPRYRAGWDFLSLRAKAGEMPEELPRWWQRFAYGDEAERAALLREARSTGETPAKRKRRRRPRKAQSAVREMTEITPTPDAP